MEATQKHHGWVHVFITHRPTVTSNFITSICSGLVVQVVSALLRGSWQDFNWHDASRGPSAIAELLVVDSQLNVDDRTKSPIHVNIAYKTHRPRPTSGFPAAVYTVAILYMRVTKTWVTCVSCDTIFSVQTPRGPILQNILRQSYDYLTIMPKLRSTYDGRLIYKKSFEELKAFLRHDSPAKL